MNKAPIYLILLHDNMLNKNGHLVTTSLTLIDVHDLARSSRTYGVKCAFVAHPSPTLRKLGSTMKNHWEVGFGATYNPNRKEALESLEIVESLDEAIQMIENQTGKKPTLVATSAKTSSSERMRFSDFRELITKTDSPFMIMLGTGWGMSESLLARAQIFLEPLSGPGEYNHLSVRSAGAIILDRILGIH